MSFICEYNTIPEPGDASPAVDGAMDGFAAVEVAILDPFRHVGSRDGLGVGRHIEMSVESVRQVVAERSRSERKVFCSCLYT